MYLKYSNQVFEFSFQNFFKNGNNFLWAFVYFLLNLSIIPKFLTLQKISLFFLQREIFNIPTAHETDVPTPSLFLSLTLSEAELHLTIRPVSTKMSKQTQASVISKRAGRRTPLTPTPNPFAPAKDYNQDRAWRIKENIKPKIQHSRYVTFTLNSLFTIKEKKHIFQKQHSIYLL